MDTTLSENVWNFSEDIFGTISVLGVSAIETVKVTEGTEISNILFTQSKDEEKSSSESENEENEQITAMKTEKNELSMNTMMNYEEGGSTTLESNLRTTTVTRRMVKTVISSSQLSSAENNITISEI